MSPSPAVLNHFGHCVTDLERSVRFYCELFGFEQKRRMSVPDDPSAQLLGVAKPLGMEAVYLVLGGTTLELLAFTAKEAPVARAREFTEPGLTHLSFCVDDPAATAARAVELGGTDDAATDVGAARFIRDPDGQRIELIVMGYRRSVDW